LIIASFLVFQPEGMCDDISAKGTFLVYQKQESKL